MTRYCLAGLTVEGFRGINNNGSPLKIKFDPNKITSIFGRNGLGKSSLFDAITYAITGNVPRLAKIQNTENASRYYLNRFHTGPAAITLTFIPDDSTGEEVTITIKRDAQGRRIVEASGSLDPDQLLASINCETLLLDYTTFNDFITSSPLDRGRTFARLLGLGSLSVIRKNLEALSNTRNLNSDCQLETLQRRLGEVQRKRDEAANKVLELLTNMEKTGSPPDSFDPSLAERLCLEALSEISALRSLVEGRRLSDIDFDKCEEQLSRVEGANETKALKQLVTTREELETAIPIDKLKRKCDALLSLAQTHMSLTTAVHNERPYKDLYESAFKIVEMGLADDKCPLCEQAWQHPSGLDLRSFLIQVLGKYREIIAIERKMAEIWSAIVGEESLVKNWMVLKSRRLQPPSGLTLERVREIRVPREDEVRALQEWITLLEQHRKDMLDQIQKAIEELQRKVPASLVRSVTVVHCARALRDALIEYRGATEEVGRLQQELDAIERWRSFISEAAREFAEAEADLVRRKIDMLQDDIRAIFRDIWAGSEIVPKLRRDDRNQRLYLMLEGFFSAQDLDAVPVLSESARNALSLSIFLAASKRRQYGGRFLVLDDVTSSFDAGHQTRLIEAIRTHIARPHVPDGLQVILLTHDGMLEKLFDQAVSNGWAWTSYKLHGTPPEGLVLVSKIDDSRLTVMINEHLDNGRVEQALPLVRQYLEYRLLEVIREVNIRVPLDFSTKEDRTMVGNMLEAIRAEVALYKRAGLLVLSAEQERRLSQALIPALVSNWVSHYSTGSGDAFSPNVVRQVLRDIDDLVRSFKYRCVCGEQPQERFYRSLSEKQKGCGDKCQPLDSQRLVS